MRRIRESLELDRFLVAVDDGDIVGNVGAFSFDMALPGGATVPVCGTTWVAVSATHRRRGLMRRMLDRLHAEGAARGEVAAILWAAEASIYGNLGYGPTHQQRITSIETRRVRFRDDAPEGGTVRYADPATAIELLPGINERAFRQRPAGLRPRPSWWRRLFIRLETPIEEKLPPYVLIHRDESGEADGFAVYTSEERWESDVARHKVTLENFVAATPEAHAGLWRVLCSLDLVAEVESDLILVDDLLPWMLVDPRAIRTSTFTDGMWLKVLDVPGLFGARTYAPGDAVVVEAGELGRWAIGGDAAVRAVRRRVGAVDVARRARRRQPRRHPDRTAGRDRPHRRARTGRGGPVRRAAGRPTRCPYCTTHF